MAASKGKGMPNWLIVLMFGGAALVCAPITLGLLGTLDTADQTATAEVTEAGETPAAQEGYWERALGAGMRAAEAAQVAEDAEQWGEVAKTWSEAIAFLKMVEAGDPQYEAAQAKIVEYRANRDAATQRQAAAPRPKSEPTVATEALRAYEAVIRGIDPSGALFGAVSLDEYDDDLQSVVVVVQSDWHYQPKAARQEVATNLWRGWVQLRLPDEADHARLRLETPSGKHVGGSRMLAGSLIWVED